MVAFPVEITNPQPETWSAPTVATLIIAGFALLVSLGSAAFNIWSWKAQGLDGHLKVFPEMSEDADGDMSIFVVLTNTGRMPLPVMLLGMGRKWYPFHRTAPFEILEGYGEFPSLYDHEDGPRPKIEPFEDMSGPVSVSEILKFCQNNNLSLRQIQFVVTTSVKDFYARIPRPLRMEIERFQEAQENQAPDSDS